MADRRRPTGNADTVRRLIEQAQEKQDQAQGKSGSGRPGHAGQRGKDKTGRAKMTLDISPERQAMLREMSEAESVALSDLVEYSIAMLYRDWQGKENYFYRIRKPARSLRVDWKLEV